MLLWFAAFATEGAGLLEKTRIAKRPEQYKSQVEPKSREDREGAGGKKQEVGLGEKGESREKGEGPQKAWMKNLPVQN